MSFIDDFNLTKIPFTSHLHVCINTYYGWFLVQLPPPPQIELVVDKPHLMGVLRRPIVRIRRELRLIGSPDTIAWSYWCSMIFDLPFFAILTAATSSEVSARRKNRHTIEHNTTKVKGEAAVAIIKKNAQDTTDPKGSLACALPWGHGWGWATLPNGIWSGGK